MVEVRVLSRRLPFLGLVSPTSDERAAMASVLTFTSLYRPRKSPPPTQWRATASRSRGLSGKTDAVSDATPGSSAPPRVLACVAMVVSPPVPIDIRRPVPVICKSQNMLDAAD